MRLFVFLCSVLWLLHFCYCKIGITVNNEVLSSAQSSCLIGNGTSFLLIFLQDQHAVVNNNGLASVINARRYGWEDVTGIIHPCLATGCPSGYEQVEQTILALRESSAVVNSIFIDTVIVPQNPGDPVWGNPSMAQGYIDDASKAFETYGMQWGLVASQTKWDLVFPGVMKYSNRLLWYPGTNDNPVFSDFVPFGGWIRPTVKSIGPPAPCGIDGSSKYKS